VPAAADAAQQGAWRSLWGDPPHHTLV